MRIAGTPLETRYHSMAGNGGCDGWKSVGIGQSAAELGIARKVQRLGRRAVGASAPKRMTTAVPVVGDIVSSVFERCSSRLHGGIGFTPRYEDHGNVYNDVQTQGTTLTETTTLPVSNFTIAQGTGTVTELGNAVPYTGLLDNLSKHPVQDIINKVLKNDAKKGLDGQAWYQFNSTSLKVVPTSGTSTSAVTLTTNGTATLTNNVAMGTLHIKNIVDTMKERNIPPCVYAAA